MKKFIQSVFAVALMVLSLSSCEDVPAPFDLNGGNSDPDTPTVVTEPAGSGTMTDPYNIARTLEIINNGTYTSDKVYVKGVVTNIQEIDTNYGNATFSLGDTSSDKTTFLVYRCYGLGGNRFTTGSEFAVGDTIVVYAELTMYNTTPETKQGGQLYSINGQTSGGSSGGSTNPISGATGDGSATTPYNVAAAINTTAALAADVTSDEVYVSGIVSSITDIDTGQYGNATYYISDDGSKNNQFLIYRGYYLGGEKFTSADQLKVGDKVIVKGQLINFKGSTLEMTQRNQLVSVNGQTSGGNTGGGNTNTGSSEGISVDGTTVTLTNSAATAGATQVTVDLSTLGFENAQEMTTITLSDGSTITFSVGEGSTTPKYYDGTKGIRLYAKNTITVAGKATIASIVFTCDSYSGTDYVGNSTATVSFSGSNATYVNEHTSASGGVQLRVKTITITYAN